MIYLIKIKTIIISVLYDQLQRLFDTVICFGNVSVKETDALTAVLFMQRLLQMK